MHLELQKEEERVEALIRSQTGDVDEYSNNKKRKEKKGTRENLVIEE